MRSTSFAVPAHPPFGGELVERWVEAIETAAAHAPAVVGHGASSEEAIDDVEWRDGDVLVVGSSSAAPAARVFLGSRASRIIRHSPVPVLVVPRSASEVGQRCAIEPGAVVRPATPGSAPERTWG
jgi:nucleotide-binding universal stress UspA family protein